MAGKPAEEAAPEAEQRGAHGPTWKGKQCEIKAARGRKQLVVQIIIAEGRAHRWVFQRRLSPPSRVGTGKLVGDSRILAGSGVGCRGCVPAACVPS